MIHTIMRRLARTFAIALTWIVASLTIAHWGPHEARAVDKFWDTSASAGLQSGDGTWNTGTTALWSTAPAGTALTTWANSNSAFFQTGGSQTVTLSGTIQANELTQTTAGTITTLNSGTLQILTSVGIINSGNQLLTINSAVTLDNVATVTINAGSGGANITINGAIGETAPGNRGFNKQGGSGTLTLNGNNTFTGGVTITNGEIILGNAGALNSTTPNDVTFTSNSNTKTLTLNGNSVTVSGLSAAGTLGTRTVQNNASGTATLTVNNATANTFTGVLANGGVGTLALSKSGAGTLTLEGANTFSGGTTISAGQITIGTGNPSALGTGGLSMSAGFLELNGNSISVANLSGVGGTIRANIGATSATFTLTAGSDNTDTTFGGVFVDGASSRKAALTKTGTGALTLSGNNSGSSALTTISGGVLRLNNANALATGNLTINGGVLELQSPTSHTRALGTGANQVQLTGGTSGFSAFGSTATVNFNNDGSTVTWGGATFNPTTLVLNESTATAALNFQNALNLGGSTRTINVNANTATLNGIVSNGGLTKGGSGTLALAAANSYTGATTVSAGTLALNSTGSLGSTAIGVSSGGTFAPRPGSGTVSAGATGAGSAGATLTLNAGSALSMTDNAIGVFNLNQQDSFPGTAFTIGAASGTAPTLTFEIGNAATGTDRINVTKAASVLATGGGITITSLAGNTSLTSGNYTLMTAASGLGVGGLTLNTPTISLSGKTYNLSLANSTSTTEILSVSVATPATAYWSGAASGNWNTLNAGDVTNWRTSVAGSIDTQQIPGSTTDVFFYTTTPAATNLSTTLGQDFSINSLTFTSAATSPVTIAGGNTLTLGTGGISVQSSSAAHTISSAVALGSAQSWTNNSSSLFTVSGNIANGANTLTIDGSGSTTLSGILGSGSGGLTKNGTGTLILSGDNSYTGATAINAGVVNIQHANALGTTAGGVTVLSGAALQMQGTISVGNESLLIAGTGVSSNGALRNISGSNTWGGTATLNGATQFQSDAGSLTLNAANSVTGTNQNLSLSGAGDGTISGTITTGSGTLDKGGAGTWTLAGSNSYSGKTFVNGGTLSFNTIANVGGGNSALGAPTTAVNGTIDLSGTLAYTGTGHTTDRVINLTGTGSLNASGSGALAFAGATSSTPIIVGNMEDLVVLGTGTGRIDSRIDSTIDTVTKSGTGNWWLAGNNTYSGATAVNQGTLRLRHDNAAGTTAGGVDVQNGATLEVDGNITVGAEALTIRGTGVSSSGALRNVSGNNYWGGAVTIEGSTGITVVNAGETLTLQGAIGENLPGTLIKNGSGTLALTQGGTYTGGTTVNAGILRVSNTSGSATGSGNVLVNANAMIAGSGNIDALVTIASAGVVSPGNSPGTLSVDDQVWDGGGKYLWEMNDATGTPGGDPGWDLLDVEDSITINATTSNKFVILITSYGGNAANFGSNLSWQIVSASTISGFNPLAFELRLLADALVPGSTGFTNSFNGTFTIRLNQGAEPSGIYVSYEAGVPEPSTLTLGGLGFALLVGVRRGRRRAIAALKQKT